MKNSFIALTLIIYLSGCATPQGFNRAEINKQLVITDADIKKALDAKPQLHTPFKIGIYFRPNEDQHWYWNWGKEEKEKFAKFGDELKNQKIISEYVYLNKSTIDGSNIKSIRLAAAQHGVDAVLVISGASDMDKYNNSLGISYILIVTGFFVPGTVTDGLFMSHAGIWDVRNGYLYLSTEAEGKVSKTTPMFFANRYEAEEIRAETRAISVDSLINKLRTHVNEKLNKRANKSLNLTGAKNALPS